MSPQLSESDLFVLLAKRRRRLLVRILQQFSTPITVGELLDRMGELEEPQPTDEARHAIHVSLVHNHLPRLDAAGVIRYDQTAETVVPGVNFDRLAGAPAGATDWEST